MQQEVVVAESLAGEIEELEQRLNELGRYL